MISSQVNNKYKYINHFFDYWLCVTQFENTTFSNENKFENWAPEELHFIFNQA